MFAVQDKIVITLNGNVIYCT